MFRISQEAIHNIVKHAHATQVILVLECSERDICLEITDNGMGFDPTAVFPGHLGLESMRERAVQCGGEIQVDSAPRRGTRIQFVIPLQPRR